ncbi:NagD protein [Salmonella enterica subsp. enterica serovar Typhimurium]|nr:NagD protein [Salmonella enterica subsp. enterica serovar Typhimurium]
MTIKNVICDIDGVLMHDNVAVPGAAEFLTGILEKGLPLVLLTNYPSQTRPGSGEPFCYRWR